MRTEDFTALVDALLPVDDGTAAFLYAKQATFVELGARQLLFFLAETTPLRSRLADEDSASALLQLLSKCGLAAEDDLEHVRTPPEFRSLSSLEPETSQPEDSAPVYRAVSPEPEASQLEEVDTSAKKLARGRQQAEDLMVGDIEALMEMLLELNELKEEKAEFQKRLKEAQEDTRRARAETEEIRTRGAKTTARRVLNLIMRAGFKSKDKAKRDIFQPCERDLELLRMARDDTGRSIIDDLHEGNLSNFHAKLWPEPSSAEAPSVEELNESIFHHDTKESSTLPVYEDQQKRAASIASVVKELVDGGIGRPVRVRLLDGHGRMLLSIINEVKKLSLNPEDHVLPGLRDR